MIMRCSFHTISPLFYSFVPKHKPVEPNDVKIVKEFISSSKNLVALTGAGISTESGIPDYRSEDVGLYARTNYRPVQYQEFIKDAYIRKRYWARNFVGWDKFSSVQPNSSHFFLKHLEDLNKLKHTITQNVDSLHKKAGSKHVVELHGTAYQVSCLNCKYSVDRHDVQSDLKLANANCAIDCATMMRPDGDVEIPSEFIEQFNPPLCKKCGMDLKPDIVFFGDNVPKATVEKVQNIIQNCDSLLVLGSSLQVFSSYRIVLQAVKENKNICLINLGPTRADDLIKLKIVAKCSDVLGQM